MRIAVTAEGESLESKVDVRFGRAKGFIVFDSDYSSYQYFENNQNLAAMQGAGIQSAKKIINEGAEILITGNMGPKAFTTLKAAGIDIYIGADGTVKEVLKKYEQGLLEKAMGANVEGHWQM